MKPLHVFAFFFISPPKFHAIVMSARDNAHAIPLRFKLQVSKKPVDKHGCLFWNYIQPNQTVSGVTKFAFEEIFVPCEERWAFEAMQQGQDVIVTNA
jgi:hypothetical protein